MKSLDESIELLISAFKTKPNDEYINKLKLYLTHDLRLNMEQIEIVCRRLPEVCKTFPTRFDVKKVSDEIKRNESKYKKPSVMPKSIVDREPSKGIKLGIPSSIEGLCSMIDEGKTNSGAFQWAMNCLGITETDLWLIYEARANGELHPVIETYKQKRGYKK